MKLGHVVLEICEQTNKQTYIQTDKHKDTLTAILHTSPGGEVINIKHT